MKFVSANNKLNYVTFFKQTFLCLRYDATGHSKGVKV